MLLDQRYPEDLPAGQLLQMAGVTPDSMKYHSGNHLSDRSAWKVFRYDEVGESAHGED